MMLRRIVLVTLGALLGLAIAEAARGAAGVVLSRGVRCVGHGKFDSGAWQSPAGSDDRAVRGCMVEDYLRRHPPAGRPRDVILRELGQPGPTSYFREYDLVYWLGPEPGLMSIDSEWLVFRFDTAGHVLEAKLVTD